MCVSTPTARTAHDDGANVTARGRPIFNQRIPTPQLQLTDESDSFLLYTLDISEDEFHALKAEQSILVG